MNRKNQATLDKIKSKPELSDIVWRDIESLFVALGGEISEGSDSRFRVYLNGIRAVFHRPHPHKETDKGVVKSVRKFLESAGE